MMESPNYYKLGLFGVLVLVLLASIAVDETMGDAMVSGTVFCDQCKDGERSLFDYPLSGMKVAVSCRGSDGQMQMWKEETTNWFGNYAFSFEGSPDLTGCYAQLSGIGDGQQGSMGCRAAAGPAQSLKLMFNMFDEAIYAVDSLLSQPAQPMSFCQRAAPPRQGGVVQPPPAVVAPTPPSPTFNLPPPAVAAPTPPSPTFNLPPPAVVAPPTPPSPTVTLPPPAVVAPPTPPTPTFKLPPMPYLQASACPYQEWTKPEHKCYWKMVEPDTKVAVAFGLIAAGKYGTDMTLREGLQGRGNLYRTLLREATTALLNSYNSMQFRYPTLSVVGNMNMALMGSSQDALRMALRFKRANSGSFGGNTNNVRCNFTPCKQ